MLKHNARGSVHTFGVESNFFDFGGSLAFFKLAKALNSELGVEVAVGTLLQSAALAAKAAGRGFRPTPSRAQNPRR